MTTKYLHKDDASIERRVDALSGPVADLYDCDGDKRWTFPGDMTDAQIHAALAFANQAYATGVQVGEKNKAHAIKACLGLA